MAVGELLFIYMIGSGRKANERLCFTSRRQTPPGCRDRAHKASAGVRYACYLDIRCNWACSHSIFCSYDLFGYSDAVGKSHPISRRDRSVENKMELLEQDCFHYQIYHVYEVLQVADIELLTPRISLLAITTTHGIRSQRY